jgi:hypothetical protein
MPDRRQHRGPHPEDARLFAAQAWPVLRSAVADVCWLLDRGYAGTSSLKLVGDRHALTQRQRVAVGRCSCSQAAVEGRGARQIESSQLSGRLIAIDGYNVLTTVEAALAGGVLLAGRDRVLRDMASVHGSFRKVAETLPAIELSGKFLARCGATECRWYLDTPVSNSGRLKTLLRETAEAHGWPWQVELVASPDRVLRDISRDQPDAVVATSDSAILDGCGPWVDLARAVAGSAGGEARIVDLWPERSVAAAAGGSGSMQ